VADQKRVVELLIRAKNELGPGLRAAATDMNQLRQVAAGLGASMVALGSAGIAGLGAMVAATIHAGTEMQELGERTGLTAEELSRFKFVAEQNNANLTDLTLGLKFLSKAMVGLSEDGQETSGLFQQLGVQVRSADGSLRGVKDVFLDTADAISKIKDPTERLSFTLALFGRGGISLAGVMKLGAKEINRLGDEAEQAGLIISQDLANASDDLDDKIKLLQGTVGGLTRTIAGELVPALIPVVDKVQAVVQELGAWARANPGLAESVVKVSVALIGVGGLSVAISTLSTVAATAAPVLAGFWAVATGPVGWAVAATAAIALVYGKVQKLVNGVTTRTLGSTGPLPFDPTSTDYKQATRDITPFPPLRPGGPPKAPRSSAEADKLEYWELTPAEQAVRLARDQAAVAKWVDTMLRTRGAVSTNVSEGGSILAPRSGPGAAPDAGAPTPAELPAEKFSAAAMAVAQMRADLPQLAVTGVQAMVQLGSVVGSTLVQNFRDLGNAVKQWGLQAVASIASVIAQTLILKALTALIPGAGGALKFLGFSQGGVVPARAAGGGIVTGGVPGRDSVPVLAQSGEGFLSRGDMSKLDQLLRQGGAGGSHYHVHVGAFLGDRGAALEFVRLLAGLQREQLTGSGL